MRFIEKCIFLLMIIFFIPLYSKDTNNRVKSVLIGDSNVGVIKYTKGFSSSGVFLGPYKGGINTQGLINKLKLSKIDKTYNTVFVAIGTNDGYKTDLSKSLLIQIKKTYPNVKNVYVIWGSRGWGGVKNKKISHQECFYKRFEENGFKIIKITNGYFPSDALAHSANQSYQIEIIKEMVRICSCSNL